MMLSVEITPLANIDDDHWRWHLGLDVNSSRILNNLYQGRSLTEAEQEQLLVLFRLTFADQNVVQAHIRGYPVYLALAMDENYEMRLKPQNLLLNLPLAMPA